ncbi:TRAP transporter substrate-binding protein [Aestuariicoccus sp. MJ-SS9]|uniref:TRAP transporter substrate-binding protein n=1 Tax=Aestuariicoccus sp. MJ-SS9 TaxID=3079855 RepID=UPI0029078F90|nr:TRAP transporter substrate-binding protein [Aestuariicoccus sp. MJ-SS9]MDU8911453.1 TRAP transporter substrate-binding protein [Aestuariicoccus sp. MJ-SS9]
MKHLLISAMAGAVALGLGASAAVAQEVTLRCQHFLPPQGSVPAFFMAPWAEKIEADSGGRIKVELYPGMQLGGKPPALYDQIRDGVIDCGWALPAYTPGRFPETEVFELPFMSAMDAEVTSKAAWDFTQKYMQERLSDIHLVAVHVHGPGVIHKKGEPVTGLDDFQGLKLRGPSRQANKLLETLGATPIGMPVPAFPEALSKGVVDGGVIPWEVVPGLKVHELAEAHTEIPGDRTLYNTFFIWGMNKAKYDSLPDDLKAVIDANSGLATSGLAGAAMDKGDDIAKTMIAERGNTIVSFDDATLAQLKELGAAQTEAWIEEAGAMGLDAAAMVEDARALIAKYDAEK